MVVRGGAGGGRGYQKWGRHYIIKRMCHSGSSSSTRSSFFKCFSISQRYELAIEYFIAKDKLWDQRSFDTDYEEIRVDGRGVSDEECVALGARMAGGEFQRVKEVHLVSFFLFCFFLALNLFRGATKFPCLVFPELHPASFKTKILLKFVPPTGPPSACVAREAWRREGLHVPPKSVVGDGMGQRLRIFAKCVHWVLNCRPVARAREKFCLHDMQLTVLFAPPRCWRKARARVDRGAGCNPDADDADDADDALQQSLDAGNNVRGMRAD